MRSRSMPFHSLLIVIRKLWINKNSAKRKCINKKDNVKYVKYYNIIMCKRNCGRCLVEVNGKLTLTLIQWEAHFKSHFPVWSHTEIHRHTHKQGEQATTVNAMTLMHCLPWYLNLSCKVQWISCIVVRIHEVSSPCSHIYPMLPRLLGTDTYGCQHFATSGSNRISESTALPVEGEWTGEKEASIPPALSHSWACISV